MNTEKLKNIINEIKYGQKEADEAMRYYEGENDIRDNKIVFIDDEGNVREDALASNYRYSNPYLKELVQQVVSYIFHEDVKFEAEDKELQNLLDIYINRDTHIALKEATEGASIKGKEWVYEYKDEDGLTNFMVVDSRRVKAFYDEFENLQFVVQIADNNTFRVWDDTKRYEYKQDKDDEIVLVNEENHTAYDEDGNVVAGYGRIPFFKLKNNKGEYSDLRHIKDANDDYDIMDSYASNELQDFPGNIHILKSSSETADISRIRMNTANTGAIKIGANEDYQVASNSVTIKERERKMDIDRQKIYSFGMGYDQSTITNASGTVTNVALRAGQSKLIQKAKGKIDYIESLIDWMLEGILNDINRLGLGTFSITDVNVKFTHYIEVNKKEEAETAQIKLNMLASVEHLLDDETMREKAAELLADIGLNIDVDKVNERLGMSGYGDMIQDLADGDDVVVKKAVEG